MNIGIVGKHFELTDPIKDYISNALDALEKYNLDITSIRTVVSADEKKGKKGFYADFTINVAHRETIVIKQQDKDLYTAIDLGIERAKKVLRREHDKRLSDRNHRESIGEVMGKLETSENLEGIDEIIPTELELYKPLEVDEALEKLKANENQIFLVFNDIDAKMRVLYKRKDGKFGLF